MLKLKISCPLVLVFVMTITERKETPVFSLQTESVMYINVAEPLETRCKSVSKIYQFLSL